MFGRKKTSPWKRLENVMVRKESLVKTAVSIFWGFVEVDWRPWRRGGLGR
jgi:hypothetical protein